MRHAVEIQKGQRYEKVFKFLGRNNRFKVRGRPTVWEVRSVSARFLSVPHAWLVNQDDPRDFRLVSCNTLADSRYYKLVCQPERYHAIETEAA